MNQALLLLRVVARSFSSGQDAVFYMVSVIVVCPPQNITLQMMYANVFSFGLSMSRLQVVFVVICNVLHTVVWALRLATDDD